MEFYSLNQMQSSDSDYNESSGSDEQDDELLDDEEYKRRKEEYTNDILDLERQFESIRHQLYKEKINQAEKKLEEVKAEIAEDYLQPLEKLKENMRIRTEVAAILRELRLKNVECQHEAEKTAALQNFEMQRHMLKEQFRLELEDKLRRLEEDRNSSSRDSFGNSSSASDCLLPPSLKKKKRSSSSLNQIGDCFFKDLPDRRKKPVTLSGPYVVYMLPETEILEDYQLIKKAIKQQPFYF